MRDASNMESHKTYTDNDYRTMIKYGTGKLDTREKPYILQAIQKTKGHNINDNNQGGDQH